MFKRMLIFSLGAIVLAGWLPMMSPTATQGTGPQPLVGVGADDPVVALRGPVHEALAKPVVAEQRPPPILAKEPPVLLVELPPDLRPLGNDVQWLGGYWAWVDERANFVWVSGIWHDLPPGREWVPGWWARVAEGWQRNSGYWTAHVELQSRWPPSAMAASPPSVLRAPRFAVTSPLPGRPTAWWRGTAMSASSRI